jgi:DNA-binding MarR family transcriptional regulator
MTSEPRWLTTDEQRAWRALIATIMLLPPALDAQLQRDSDLSVFDFGVLAMLSEAPNRTLRMGQLAALNDSSLSRLSHVVKRLEDRGAIVRNPSATDRRANDATLTDVGFAMVEQAAPAHVERVRQVVFDQLSKRQVGQLAEIGDAIRKNLDPEQRLPIHQEP